MEKTDFIAAFLVMLVVTLPFYSASVYASIDSVSIKGTSNIEGVARPKDSLEFKVKVSLENDPSISASQVVLGTNTPFQKCQLNQQNETECTLSYNNTFEARAVPFSINLFNDDGSKESSASSIVAIDALPPSISLILPGNEFGSKDTIKGEINAIDLSCSDPGCTNRCSGVKKIEAIIGTYKKTIDILPNMTINACTVKTNLEIPADQIANGEAVLSLVATDRFDQSSLPAQYTLLIDRNPPAILTSSFGILKNGAYIDALGPRDIPASVIVNISGDDLNTDSVVADFSALNPNAELSSLKPSECTPLGTTTQCKWQVTLNYGPIQATPDPSSNPSEITTLPQQRIRPITINASDVRGNKASVTIPKVLQLDSQGPEIISLITPYLIDDKFYARSLGNTVTATIKEEAGLHPSEVKLHANGNFYPAAICRKAGNWICTFENVALTQGTMSIESDTTDILLNPVTQEKKVDVIVDGQAPVINSIVLKSVGNFESDTTFKIGDKISVTANVTEKNQLTAYADFSKFIKGAKKVAGDCVKENDDYNTCKWLTDPIDTQASGDIRFNFTDPVQNKVETTKQLQTLGIDSTSSPDYWTNSFTCSPSALDRQLGPFVNQRLYCSITLAPKSKSPSTVAMQNEKCSSNPLLQKVELINKETASKNPILKLTFRKDAMNVDELKLDCSFDLYSKVDNKVTKNPEIEKMNITVKFYNMPLGELSEEVEENIKNTKEHIEDLGKVIGTLNKIMVFAKRICQVFGIVYNVVSVYYIVTGAVGEAEKAACASVVAAAEAAGIKVTRETLCTTQQISEQATDIAWMKSGQKFCKFVNCQWAPGILGNLNEWMTDKVNSLPMADYFPGAGLGADVNNPSQSNREDQQITPPGQEAQFVRTRMAGYLNPEDNLFVGAAFGCIPGVIAGLEKYRQIQCLYADCLVNAVGNDGLPLKACQDLKSYSTCKYVRGEIFAAVPYTALFDHYTGIIKEALSNPFSAAGVGIGALCMHTCRTITCEGGTLYKLCEGFRVASKLGEVWGNINSIKNEGFMTKQDYCSRLESSEDDEEPSEDEK